MATKVMITGAGGFIGSHLTEACVAKGWRVKAFVRYNSSGSWGWLDHCRCREDIEVVAGDIRDYDSVHQAVRSCDTVLHLAALIGIPYSYVSPTAYIRTNIEGTYNVLQSARESDVENILVTSTSEVFGTAQYVPIDEKHSLVGQSPYAASKISADQLALSYYHSYGLPVKIARPFNTFGPRQSARAIIPAIVSQLLAGHDRLNLGNLHPTRDFTYVLDTVAGMLAISECNALFGEVTNIGTGTETSVRDLAGTIARILRKEVDLVTDKSRIRPDKSEVHRLCCDNTKLVDHTNWRPQYNLQDGLLQTIDWMKAHKKLYNTQRYNI